MLKVRLLFIYVLFLPRLVWGQVIVHGVIKEETGTVLSDVFISVVKKSDSSILCFAITDSKGAYHIKYDGNEDSLYVKASRLDFTIQYTTIVNRSQRLDFTLKPETTVLKEVVVRPKSVWRNRDTVNYSVYNFAVKSDRTIADILKKLPGVEVNESGKISYNGEPINRFYVEGMDLMGGQYNVINNNLGHRSVETVQVLENHEPIKALQEQSMSDKAAINLVLKDDAKAKWLAAGKLGLGFSPLLWENELTLMRFARNTQGSYVYKNSNTGYDVAQDLLGHYGIIGISQSSDLLAIPTQQPNIKESKRYLFNNAHMLTANQLWKLNEDYTLRFNADYLNDQQEQNSSNKTTYFLPDGNEVVVDELSQVVLNKNQAKLAFTLMGNHAKYYLQDVLKVQGDWSNTLANISSNKQRLKNPSVNISNNFSWIKFANKIRIDVQSNNRFIHLPQSLTVKPGLYSELLNDSLAYDYLKQDATLNDLLSDTYAGLSITKGRWRQNSQVGAKVSWQRLTSLLHIADRTEDEYSNRINFLQAKYYLNTQVEYIGKKITSGIYMPVGLITQNSNNKVDNEKSSDSRFYFNPSFSFKYDLNQLWSSSLRASYNSNFDNIQSIYTGYLLTSYRSILRNSGDYSNVDAQSYSLSLSYKDPIKLANAYVVANFTRTHFDKLFEQAYNGILSIRKAVPYNHFTNSKMINFNVSKGFNRYITKVGLSGGYSQSSSTLLQNSNPIDYLRNTLSLRFLLNGEISSFASCSYSLQYTTTKPTLKGGNSATYSSISKLAQDFQLSIYPIKNLIVGMNMNQEKSYGKTQYPSTFFIDLMLQYKLKQWEFSVNFNNISNTQDYVIAYYGEFYSSVNAFELRPRNVIFSVRFSL